MAKTRQLAGVFATAARNRTLLRIGAAFAAFIAAEVGVWVALLVFGYEAGGATGASIIALVQLLPSAVLAPWIGSWADRRNPGRVLFAGYVLQAAAMAAVAAAIAVDASTILVYSLAPLVNLAICLTRPAQAALLPSVVTSPQELAAANAGQGWLESASTLAAPLAVAVLLAAGGPALAVAGMAVVVAAGGLLVATVAGPEPFDDAGDATARALQSLRAIAGNPAALTLVAALGGQYVLMGALDLLCVVLALDVLDMGAAGAGYLTAAFGLGGLVAVVVTASLVGRERLAPALIAGGALAAAPLLVLAVVTTLPTAIVLIALAGLGRSVFDVTGRTLLQRTASPEALAGAFALLESLLNVGLAAGSLIVPILVGAGGPTAALAGSGAVLCLALLAVLPRLRTLDATAVVPLVEIHALRAIRIFAALPAPALETLARALVRTRVAAGSVLIRQGDVGDRYYAIAEGELDVGVDGVYVRTCTTGEGVGEVALLHATPRTATVTARTDAELWALDREPFLLALTGHVPVAAHADWVAPDRELPEAAAGLR